jgi:hypothetical protein
LSVLKPKTIKDYLKAASSFATERNLPNPLYCHNRYGSRIGNGMFPALQDWINFLEKWDGPPNKAWSLDLKILLALQAMATDQLLTPTACATDGIILGSYTGSRVSEYCKGTTRRGEQFAIVPKNRFTQEWGGLPIALISRDFTFMDASHALLTHDQARNEAQYVSIRFRFDKGGGRNFSTRTFRRLTSNEYLCPIHTSLRMLHRWRILGSDINYPVCCYKESKTNKIKVLADTQVTATIRQAVVLAYPNPTHIFRENISFFRTHSVRVFACCTLLAAGLTEAQIEFKLRWSSTAWKTYIRESLAEVDSTSLVLFQSALVDLAHGTPQHDP